jgi:hypothetical protein
VTVVSEPHTHISDTVTAFVIGAVEQHVGLPTIGSCGSEAFASAPHRRSVPLGTDAAPGGARRGSLIVTVRVTLNSQPKSHHG